MTDTPYFVIDDLTIGYHKVPVIRDISVNVQKGEIIALIGPNGAGKSTLLKTIARDLEPIRGKIFLEGRDMQTITYRELSKKLAVILTERIKVELTTCPPAGTRTPGGSACSAARTSASWTKRWRPSTRSSLPSATSTPSATASASACCSRAPSPSSRR